MQLTLSVLRCPPAVTPETRILNGGEFTIGRGPGVDWVLADVSQMVSRRHCILAYRSGEWQVIDDSVNGTFPNKDDEPIGKGNTRTLHDQDRLRIGPYEIEVLLAEEGRPQAGDAQGYKAQTQAGLYDDDPFADPLWPQQDGSSGTFGNPFTQNDHSSALNDRMSPPRTVERRLHPAGPIPIDNLLPEGWENDLLADLPGSAFPRSTAPAPLNPVSVSPPPASVAQNDDSGLLAAFLAGAGLPDARPEDAVATMRRLGETYRALVSGLRAVLVARAAIKSEFRIEQTMIKARGNNPLKFSANDDDAVAALLGVGRHTDMAPAKAVHDALRDIRLHELASMAAMQAAVRALLQGLDPDIVRASVEQGGGKALRQSQNKARAWDAYEVLHAHVTNALSDDFESVFGKAFARAYEKTLDDLAALDRP